MSSRQWRPSGSSAQECWKHWYIQWQIWDWAWCWFSYVWLGLDQLVNWWISWLQLHCKIVDFTCTLYSQWLALQVNFNGQPHINGRLTSYCTTDRLTAYCTTGRLTAYCTTGRLTAYCTTVIWLPTVRLVIWLPTVRLTIWLPTVRLTVWLPTIRLVIWLPIVRLFISNKGR